MTRPTRSPIAAECPADFTELQQTLLRFLYAPPPASATVPASLLDPGATHASP